MKIATTIAIAAAWSAVRLPAETKLKLENLPAAVQATVKEQTKGATINRIDSETEHGKTVYEIETMLNGKSRDLEIDRSGAVLETEDEVDIDSIPAAARNAIRRKAAGGAINKVEKLVAGSNTAYEAGITSKAGKKSEVVVNADGTPHKE